MKKAIVTFLMGLGIVCSVKEADAREFKEHISKESHFQVMQEKVHFSFIIFQDLLRWKVTQGIK